MYEKTRDEIQYKGLVFDRFYSEACKDSIKKGFYNEIYIEKEKGMYLKLSSAIVGQRELDLQGKEKDTRVRFFLIYVNCKPVNEIKEKPKQYKFMADRVKDKDGDKVVKEYLNFYMAEKGELIGCVGTKKEAFEIVKNIYLKKLDDLIFAENKKTASVLKAPLSLTIENLDNLNIDTEKIAFA